MFRIFRTRGLISEDRSNKATLLLTIPGSSLSRLQRILGPPRYFVRCRFELRFDRGTTWGSNSPMSNAFGSRRTLGQSRWTHLSLPYCRPPKPGGARSCASRTPVPGAAVRSSFPSADSDLEAFSHNPGDGSFSPATFRSSENTNYRK